MYYRRYGQTDKDVSIIGFGGMRFGKDDEESIRAIHHAAEMGINYFDTAPGYCDDQSEILFGKAFKTLDKPIYVSTKSSIQSQPKADDIRQRIDEALKRMHIEKITFFHMWCIMNWEHFEKVIAPGGPYEGALKARDEGLVDHVVFSTHANGADIRKMCESRLFEGVTLGYNIFNHSNRYDGILAAHENDMGVAIMNPLGGGMVPSAAEKLGFIVRKEGDSVVQAALRFVLSHKEVTTALAGMGTVQHVEENAVTGTIGIHPDPDLVSAIKADYKDLGQALCTACSYCLPCPEQIRIPAILSALNHHFMEMPETAVSFYNFFKKITGDKWVPASQCSDCGLCETRCTQHLEIRQLLKQAVELFESESDQTTPA